MSALTKIIFLDIDGVLNCADTIARAGHYEGDERWHERHIDLEMSARLNRLVERTDAQIVISSSWRVLYSIEEMKEILSRRGFHHSNAVIDQTPRFRRGPRGKEIGAWLHDHPEVKRFVILDDDSDMDGYMDYLVHTSFQTGLQDIHVEAAVAMLWSEA